MNNVDDINYKLIGKLFVNVAPNVDQKFSDNYIKYFLRILNSQLNVTTNNEANIMNLIVDKAIKISPNTNQDKKYNTMERLQNLYSALVNKKVLKSRWGILYALLRLSQDKNDEFRESNKLLSRIFSLKNETNNYTINTSPYVEHHNKVEQSTLSNNKTFQSPLVVISSKTNKHITEKELINDLLFVLQGIDGHYINFDSLTNSFALNSLIPFQENIYDIVLILTELGWLYKKVANHLNFFNEAQIPSQFIQSFSSAIQSELNEYYKLISLFKKMNLKEEENNDIEELSLKKIFLWTLEPIERMKWLAIACEGIYTLRGTSIMSQIYSYVKYCGAEAFLQKVFEDTSKPLLLFIKNWIYFGELQDPFKEFFIEINERTSDDDIWTGRYQLIITNIPIFLSKNISQKIFEIGKCINFIRKFCNNPIYSLASIKSKFEEVEHTQMDVDVPRGMILLEDMKSPPKRGDANSYKKCLDLINSLNDDSKINLELLNHLISEIDLIHSEVNKDLVGIIFNKFHFKENLNSINRYLLLGQGDMMQYLMDLLFNELKKPATQIYKHNLLSILETAIRASNAQYHDQDCLKKLNIKLMDSNTGDTGWDIFVLEYNVDLPLNIIFTRPLLKEYQKLFFFFWKLKRLEFSQDHQIWRNFMTYSHTLKGRFDHIRPYIHKSMMFNQQVIHFISNLHNYIALEVLDTQYKKILEKLPYIEKLDDLIEVHKKFVDNVIEQSLLNQDNNLIYKKILQIFDLIFRFKTAQDVLITTLFEEYYRKMDNYSMSMNETNNAESQLSNEIKFSKEAYNQICVLFEEFKNDVSELISSIDLIGKGNLKYLAMKLDYNYYYSEREIENIHKFQGGMTNLMSENRQNDEDEEEYYEDNEYEFNEDKVIDGSNNQQEGDNMVGEEYEHVNTENFLNSEGKGMINSQDDQNSNDDS